MGPMQGPPVPWPSCSHHGASYGLGSSRIAVCYGQGARVVDRGKPSPREVFLRHGHALIRHQTAAKPASSTRRTAPVAPRRQPPGKEKRKQHDSNRAHVALGDGCAPLPRWLTAWLHSFRPARQSTVARLRTGRRGGGFAEGEAGAGGGARDTILHTLLFWQAGTRDLQRCHAAN
jgi:hypothetical protein